MNTEVKPSVRRDVLVATFILGALGLLWIVFRLYWQGLLLLAAAGAVGTLGARRAPKDSPPSPPRTEPTPPRARAEKPRRSKKRKRRK